MKKLLFALILICAGWWGALNQVKLKSWWDEVTHAADHRLDGPSGVDTGVASTEETVQEQPEKQDPPPSTVGPNESTPPPPPDVRDMAFYTRERVSQMTPGGVVSIPERTRVQVIEEQDGMLLVEGAGKRVLAARSKLTSDPVEIGELLQGGVVAAKNPVLDRKAATADKAAVRESNQIKRQVLGSRIREADRQINDLRFQAGQLRWEGQAAKARGRPSTYNDSKISDLERRIAALVAQRASYDAELARIPR